MVEELSNNFLKSAPQQCVITFALILTLLPMVGGWTLFSVVRKNASEWMKTLKFPKILLPPKWLRIIVWISIYCGVGYASFIVFRDGNGFYGRAKVPLILYISQLLQNWAFIPLFFGAHKLKCSVCEIILLDITATICGISFYFVNPIAGIIFIPYVLWHLLATTFAYVVYRDNYQSGLKRFQNEEFMRPDFIQHNIKISVN